jgi:hypothetical protein
MNWWAAGNATAAEVYSHVAISCSSASALSADLLETALADSYVFKGALHSAPHIVFMFYKILRISSDCFHK